MDIIGEDRDAAAVRRTGMILMVAGALFALAPLLLAVVGGIVTWTSPTSDLGAGAFLWLLIVTLPLGLLVALAGGVFVARERVVRRQGSSIERSTNR